MGEVRLSWYSHDDYGLTLVLMQFVEPGNFTLADLLQASLLFCLFVCGKYIQEVDVGAGRQAHL